MPQYTASTITDPVLDGLYETLRLYQHGAFSVACPSVMSAPANPASHAAPSTAPAAGSTGRS
ncbi:hypothetical protein AB0E81_39010 [Streptomyces sp. NPDC033538]|uniref:hypothetical protein n=1 Tax=Streptomyces sp. NPDC033538 TaxID=3155367 RepID=UPI0033ECA41E